MINTGKLKGITIFITGASRGIGKAIALKAAKDGANIVIAAKTAEPHPKLPGTIYSAAEEVEKSGGKALPCVVDIRFEDQITKAVEEAVAKFGGIDILINNASAISLTTTVETKMKQFDLMHCINARGTFLVSKTCIPYLKKGKNPHILNLSPPINLNPVWFENHLAYTMAKYGMSFCVLGMSKEFKKDGIAVNALWPKTAIKTSAMKMLFEGEGVNYTRKPEIVADAAYAILIKDSTKVSGNFFLDEDVLKAEGITDFRDYAYIPENNDVLMLDFFLDEATFPGKGSSPPSEPGKVESSVDPKALNYEEKVEEIFELIRKSITDDLVKQVQGVFQFNVKGMNEGHFYIDLKNGSGKAGRGKPPTAPDATVTINAKDFYDLTSGKLKPTKAFTSGKLRISGKLHLVIKLEKIMSALKSKL